MVQKAASPAEKSRRFNYDEFKRKVDSVRFTLQGALKKLDALEESVTKAYRKGALKDEGPVTGVVPASELSAKSFRARDYL